jgi:hypothetical protein
MAAPGFVRCRTCGRDQRAPRPVTVPHGPRDREVVTQWWVTTCGYCRGPIVAPTAPVAVLQRYQEGWDPPRQTVLVRVMGQWVRLTVAETVQGDQWMETLAALAGRNQAGGNDAGPTSQRVPANGETPS